MIRGKCLCGGVQFEVDKVVKPFELCHCSRCRKVSGSAFMSAVSARADDFRLITGVELIHSFEAPLIEQPPVYRVSFCSRCGSPLPNLPLTDEWFEIPAGLLDDDPGIAPDKHIFVDYKSDWYSIADSLPQLSKRELIKHRLSLRNEQHKKEQHKKEQHKND